MIINFLSSKTQTPTSMLKKILKYSAYVVLFLLVTIGILLVVVNTSFNKRLNKEYPLNVRNFDIKEDSASYALGKHIALTRGCTDCHGDNFAGRIFIDDPGLGTISGPNLTRGKGGIPADYSREDFIRAIRHGIKRDGKSVIIMPSYEYAYLSDEDLGALVFYLENVDPVDNVPNPIPTTLLAKVLTMAGEIKTFSAEFVDHQMVQPKALLAGINLDFGKYISVNCIGCHKDDLKGGKPIIPGSPLVSDITSTGVAGKWTEEQFINTLRTGKTPEGKELQNQYMPWEIAKNFSDDELKALYLYLKSI
jgi:cytochrome c553